MQIELEGIGRRFNREWIFKGINYTFFQGESYAVTGPNGSGKSTLLQVIAGSMAPTAGTVKYTSENKEVGPDDIYRYLEISAPYIELVEEFTLEEQVRFHFRFKQYREGFDLESVIGSAGLAGHRHKQLRNFSSGMKQRTRLALAFFSDSPVVLLDEPASNLDAEGISWYNTLVTGLPASRLLIICSNQEHEYQFCKNRLTVTDFKG